MITDDGGVPVSIRLINLQEQVTGLQAEVKVLKNASLRILDVVETVAFKVAELMVMQKELKEKIDENCEGMGYLP